MKNFILLLFGIGGFMAGFMAFNTLPAAFRYNSGSITANASAASEPYLGTPNHILEIISARKRRYLAAGINA